MPYTNAKHWAMKGNFKVEGKPYVTKDEKGHIYTGFGDAIGCPGTARWQQVLHKFTLRLFNEYRVDGVYFDQLDAPAYANHDRDYPAPQDRRLGDWSALCMDMNHGHPLGGRGWWIKGYQQALMMIRRDMPEDKILIGEHSSSMYTKGIDGGLVWSWGIRNLNRGGKQSYRNQHTVPAVPAVYGGTVQYFGRPPHGTSDKFAAEQRVKASTMLVYGNQLGWWPVSVLSNTSLAKFQRRIAQLRGYLIPYLNGNMRRPPYLGAPLYTIPWNHKGRTYSVTTKKVRVGVWQQRGKQALALIFANPSMDVVTIDVDIALDLYNIDGPVVVQKIGPGGVGPGIYSLRIDQPEYRFCASISLGLGDHRQRPCGWVTTGTGLIVSELSQSF